MQQLCDLSREMIVSRHLNGIKLQRPEQLGGHENDGQLLSLGNLLAQPYNVFFYDHDHIIEEVNDACWSSCGFNSRKDALKNSVWAVCREPDQVKTIHKNNRYVTSAENILTVDEHMRLKNESEVHAVSFKFPWYGTNNELLGVFGCAALVDQSQLARASGQLAMIAEQFFSLPSIAKPAFATREIHGKYFSTREAEVIHLIMNGRTLKETALQMGLSQRTVESYFSNIKLKLNVKTKSEFFAKMLADIR